MACKYRLTLPAIGYSRDSGQAVTVPSGTVLELSDDLYGNMELRGASFDGHEVYVNIWDVDQDCGIALENSDLSDLT